MSFKAHLSRKFEEVGLWFGPAIVCQLNLIQVLDLLDQAGEHAAIQSQNNNFNPNSPTRGAVWVPRIFPKFPFVKVVFGLPSTV